MPRYLVSLICGLLFGVGLALSGMTRPLKVLGFLDVSGKWDPSLIFVLGAAVIVATVAFHFILQRTQPLLAPSFDLPTTKRVDGRLIVGALIFGVGWGIAGYCPGPAIALLAARDTEALYFLPAMVAWVVAVSAHNERGEPIRPSVRYSCRRGSFDRYQRWPCWMESHEDINAVNFAKCSGCHGHRAPGWRPPE